MTRSRTDRSRMLASLLGAIGIVLWATETVLITFTVGIPPLQTVGLAFAFAALLSPAVWLVTGDDPKAAFRQPPKVWIVTVGSLVGYHACIYYATQKAPPAAAALLQGTTPLMIVLGSALLPGERLRWWHVVGSLLGFAGILLLIDGGGVEASGHWTDAAFYLGIVGAAAALWGLYSIASRSFGDVPTSALGVFYAASAAISLALHTNVEAWVTPDAREWLAIAALGLLPMGLALYCWDFGVKHGDIQALGAISYVEPFIGATLVAAVGQGDITFSLVMAGVLVVSGAALASSSLFVAEQQTGGMSRTSVQLPMEARRSDYRENDREIETRLLDISVHLLQRLRDDRLDANHAAYGAESLELQHLLSDTIGVWDALLSHRKQQLSAPMPRYDRERSSSRLAA